ncbi:glutamine-hydrolyzing GMP synthase [Candidatus Peregrinibacteria bacterium]|nr:glutamine-hydrolyzing GMP synthase [Candidatus Peregrinibacteria bacterium]
MDKIAVLDFGGQYAHLIANRVRRMGVYSEILDGTAPAQKLKDYMGIILSGGPASVNAPESPKADAGIYELGVPVLGICYGHQMTAYALGGEVEPGVMSEYGPAVVKFQQKKGIFEGLENEEKVWMSHFDQVVKVPEGFEIVGGTEDCPIAAMADYKRNFYSMQFHPEVTHTPCGKQIFENFIALTGAKREWNLDQYVEKMMEEIKMKVGGKKVFLMISGGVDSTVAFLLLEKVLGSDRVYGLFVDTGFMRMNERKEVEEALKSVGIGNLHVYDASEEYFAALKEIYEPEKKRQIIGDLFLDIQEKVSERLGLNPDEWFLGQGTIYPDTIETGGTRHADVIKTHHNQVERIKKLDEAGKVIEPLKQLYKDEVRLVGERLGLPEHLVWRHPFPGPGLAVRCLCAKGLDNIESKESLEAEMQQIADRFGMKIKVLPIKSVGVQGDERTYRHPALVYGKPLSWDDLDTLSSRLTNQFKGVNRVVYGLSPDAFDSFVVDPSDLSRERISTIQQADMIVMNYLAEAKINREIWQFPTVLLPLKVNNQSGESLVLRPVCSEEAMTANFYRMDFEKLNELIKRLIGLKGISAVFYDVTNKPPGTIEWE